MVAAVATAVAVALIAVIAICVGMLWRRIAGPIVVLVATVVLPYLFLEPSGPGLGVYGRVTPMAGFELQQVFNGWWPSTPWSGLAVLVLWTAAALAITAVVLHRRDA